MNFFDWYNWFFWILFVVSFLLRGIPPFKQIWWVFKWLLIMLFVMLFANYAKDSIKKWWND